MIVGTIQLFANYLALNMRSEDIFTKSILFGCFNSMRGSIDTLMKYPNVMGDV